MTLSKIRQVLVNGKKKHTKEYATWSSMKARCLNNKNKSYKHYGGRGIEVCASWIKSFDEFYNDMGPAPSQEMTLERKNVNKGYSKDNCIWASKKMQANNTRSNRFVNHNGLTDTLKLTAEREALNYKALWHQVVRQGLTIDEAKARQKSIINRPKLTRDLLIELYVVKNLNCRDTAKETCWGKGAIQKKLHEYGIPVNQFKKKNKRSIFK